MSRNWQNKIFVAEAGPTVDRFRWLQALFTASEFSIMTMIAWEQYRFREGLVHLLRDGVALSHFFSSALDCSSTYTQYNPINWILDYTLQIDETLVLPLIAFFSPNPSAKLSTCRVQAVSADKADRAEEAR